MAINNDKRLKDDNVFVYDPLVSRVPAAAAGGAAAAGMIL